MSAQCLLHVRGRVLELKLDWTPLYEPLTLEARSHVSWQHGHAADQEMPREITLQLQRQL